jgi:hypothetical protein
MGILDEINVAVQQLSANFPPRACFKNKYVWGGFFAQRVERYAQTLDHAYLINQR